MRHLGRADAEGDGTEGPMGRSMAVAADDEKAGQGQPLFGADHMHDALPGIAHGEVAQAMGLRIGRKARDHARDLVAGGLSACGRVMVGDAEGQPRFGDGKPAFGDLAEGVVRAFVHEMPVHPEKVCPVRARGHDMRGPDLVEQGAGGGHDVPPITGSQCRAPSSPARASCISSRNMSGR